LAARRVSVKIPGQSIEKRAGMDRPDYQVPEDRPVEPVERDNHILSFWEGIFAFLVPIVGLGMSIWRFGRGDIGPGIADLMLCFVGSVAVIVALANLQ
jgi:hypothetical protein